MYFWAWGVFLVYIAWTFKNRSLTFVCSCFTTDNVDELNAKDLAWSAAKFKDCEDDKPPTKTSEDDEPPKKKAPIVSEQLFLY